MSNKEFSLNKEGINLHEINEGRESKSKDVLEPNLEAIKTKSLETIVAENKEMIESSETPEQENIEECRPLSDLERKELIERTGMTEANAEKCTIDSDGIINLKCINSEYAGMKHPETGISYVEKIIDVNGVKIRVVVPEFPSVVDVILPDEMKMETESEQFNYLNGWLKNEVKNNPQLKAEFNEMQLEMIEAGLKPKGFTWHHNEECCKMQLVKFEIHNGTRHTGGNSIWSGGN